MATLDIFERDDVLAANRTTAAKLNAALEPLRELPVRHVRNTGMIWAFDVKEGVPDFAQRFYQAALAQGLLLRPVGNTVYFMPPYVIGDEEIASLSEGTIAILRHMLQ